MAVEAELGKRARRRRRSACTRRARATIRSRSTFGSTCATAGRAGAARSATLVEALVARAPTEKDVAAARVHAPPARAAHQRGVPAGVVGRAGSRARRDVDRVRARPARRCRSAAARARGRRLPIDRALVARLLAPVAAHAQRAGHGGRSRLRARLHVGRARARCSRSAASATDVVDFATSEFGSSRSTERSPPARA